MTTWYQQAADLFEIQLTSEQVGLFEHYETKLLAWNAHTNLTAISAPEDIRIRHFLDSLSLVRVMQPAPGLRVIDVGAGAGFPGLPLAITFPEIYVTLLEATGKKVAFLDHVVETLALSNVRTAKARAEEAGQNPRYRARYDVVLARAVARLPALLEYTLPLVKVGGICIAMKGQTAEQEATDSEYALRILGGTLEHIDAVQLPGVEDNHYLIVVKKTATTPAAYPRNPGTPTRKPLMKG